ncbi:MAG: tetratricopeptide repeat protein [Acidobacteriota bacterium]|nr:tetratricopeptide repeat protein [Acidobacteriota bacterium]
MRNHRRLLLPAVAGLVLALGGIPSPAQTIPEYEQQADQLRRDHRVEEAIALLQAGMERHPGEPRLLLPLSLLLIESGRADKAEEHLQRVLALLPLDPEAHRSLGEAYLQQGRLPQAIRHFQQSNRLRNGDERVHYRLAFLFLIQERLDLAVEHTRRAIEIDPGEPRFRQLYSLLLGIQGREEDSYEQLRIARRLDPADASILFRMSEKERAAGRTATALESLKLASGADPENPLYHSELAQLHSQLGQEREAAESAGKARELYQAFEDYIEALSLMGQGKILQALPLLEPAVERHPEFTSGSLLLADAYQRLDRPQPALQLYLQTLERDPSNTKAMQEATWILAGRSDFGSALRILAKVPRAHLNQSLIEAYWKQDQQQPEAALERFRRVESRNPLNPGLLQWISYCLYTQGQKEEALRVLRKIADLRPDDAGVQRRIGEIELEGRREMAFRHMEAKNWAAALAAFSDLAGDSQPGDRQASYQLHLAYCHQQLGQLRQAARAYTSGLRSHPQAHWARLNLASTLYRLSRFREAVEQWERLPVPSKTAPIHFQLGVCYLHLDRYDRAEAAFRQSLAKGNRSPQLFYNLGTTLLRRFKTAEGWALIRRSAAANYPPALSLLRRAGLTGR